MDVNGTKFHLLLTRDDWARGALAGSENLGELWKRESAGESVPEQEFSWDENASALTLQKHIFKFNASRGDRKLDLESRRGAARDRYGNWYWIDDTELKIKVLSIGSGNVSDFYPASSNTAGECRTGDFQPLETAARTPSKLRGLTVTVDHYLAVGTIDPAGLLIFDLFAGGPPSSVLWRRETPFSPFDMAARGGGGVFVLDRENKRYWTLDRNFDVIGAAALEYETRAGDFQPVEKMENPARVQKAEPTLYPEDFSALRDPVAIEALPDDTALILDLPDESEDFSRIYRYYRGALLDRLETKNILAVVDDPPGQPASPPEPFRLRGFDFAFLQAGADETDDRLFVVTDEGNQAFSFRLVCTADLNIATAPPLPPTVAAKNFELQPVPEYFPLRLFGGGGITAAGDRVYYDSGDRRLPLTKQNRPSFETRGSFMTQIFDGKEANCLWHRLLLDACLPPETRIDVFSRTAESENDLPFGEWVKEPPLYLRSNGSELPFSGRETRKEKGAGTWELLLQRAAGRFLQLRLDFSGDGQRSPGVSALRVYYPRFSYLQHYLPSIYREDEASAFFLDRFLANFEGIYTTLEERIAAVQMLFDVRSAPGDALEWLADWLGVALDPAWTEEKRRLFISHAVDFYQYRGTPRGLRIALRLALDSCADESIFEPPTAARKRRDPIRIVERFMTRRTPELIPADSHPNQNQPRLVAETEKWQPQQGAEIINRRYRERFEEAPPKFTLGRPADEKEAVVWDDFVTDVFGFVPSASAAAERARWQNFLRDAYDEDLAFLKRAHETNYKNFEAVLLPRGTETNAALRADWRAFVDATTNANRTLWQDFLARRYQRIALLNAAYGTNWSSFDDVALLDQLPHLEKPAADWLVFESGVLPMHRTAHRFTVMIPALLDGGRAESVAEQNRKLGLVRRIVDLEKPAHTIFDFRFYWNLFRLEEVRLGSDTLLGLGSRDPLLNPELVLGQSYIGESRLGVEQPEKYRLRYVLGNAPPEKN